MGSNVPHQGSNKADALSAELQGRLFNGLGMLTPVPDLVNRAFAEQLQRTTLTAKQKEIARVDDLFSKEGKELVIRPRESVPGFPRTRDDHSARHR